MSHVRTRLLKAAATVPLLWSLSVTVAPPARAAEGVDKVDPGKAIIEAAKNYLSKPYKFGATGKRGFDCSAFTQQVYADSGIPIPRTVSKQAADRKGRWVEKPQRGDLVFFRNTYKRGLSHVGIYAGNNEMIHAGTEAGKVERVSLNNAYFAKHFSGFRRYAQSDGYDETFTPLKPTTVVRNVEKGSPLPFWLAATGLVGGVVGGLVADSAATKTYFAIGGTALFAVGITWGSSVRIARMPLIPGNDSRVAQINQDLE